MNKLNVSVLCNILFIPTWGMSFPYSTDIDVVYMEESPKTPGEWKVGVLSLKLKQTYIEELIAKTADDEVIEIKGQFSQLGFKTSWTGDKLYYVFDDNVRAFIDHWSDDDDKTRKQQKEAILKRYLANDHEKWFNERKEHMKGLEETRKHLINQQKQDLEPQEALELSNQLRTVEAALNDGEGEIEEDEHSEILHQQYNQEEFKNDGDEIRQQVVERGIKYDRSYDEDKHTQPQDIFRSYESLERDYMFGYDDLTFRQDSYDSKEVNQNRHLVENLIEERKREPEEEEVKEELEIVQPEQMEAQKNQQNTKKNKRKRKRN